MNAPANASVEHVRLVKFLNITLHILRSDTSVIAIEDTLYWAFTLLGFLSNLLLVIVILLNRKELLGCSSNLLLLNLGLANLLSATTRIAVKAHFIGAGMDRGSSRMLIRSFGVITECQGLLSNWTLAVLAVFRYFAVISPLQFKAAVTRKKTITIIVLIWLVAVALSVPLVVIMSPRQIIENGEVSQEYFVDKNVDLVLGYAILLDCLSNFPAAMSIMILYPLILYKLRGRKKQKERSENFRQRINDSIRRVTYIFISFFIYILLDVMVMFSFIYFLASDALDATVSAATYSSLKFVTATFIPFQIFHTIMVPLIHALLTDNYKQYYLPSSWRSKKSSARDECVTADKS